MIGVHVSGQDGIAADAVFSQIQGHACGQAQYPGFGRPVGGIPFPGSLSVHRGGADNAAALSLLHHGARRLLTAEEKSLESYVQIQIPVFFAEFQKCLASTAVGVVDQNVDAAEARQELAEHFFDLGGGGNIALEKFGFAALLANQLQGFIGVGIGGQIVDAHIAASFGQGQGDAAADAALAAGDKGFFAEQGMGIGHGELLSRAGRRLQSAVYTD